jgi:hypothetical protein
MAGTEHNRKLSIPEMLGKLDELYKREEETQQRIKALFVLLEQLREDIELAEQMIMYTSNRNERLRL